MTHPDIDGRRPGRSSDEHDFQNWSLRPVVDDPAVGARMRKAIRLRAREALVEAAMSVRERDAHNLAKIEERENAFGAIFGWTPDDDLFLWLAFASRLRVRRITAAGRAMTTVPVSII